MHKNDHLQKYQEANTDLIISFYIVAALEV